MIQSSIPYTGYSPGYNVIVYKGEYDIHDIVNAIKKIGVREKIATDMATIVVDEEFVVVATVPHENCSREYVGILKQSGLQAEYIFQE